MQAIQESHQGTTSCSWRNICQLTHSCPPHLLGGLHSCHSRPLFPPPPRLHVPSLFLVHALPPPPPSLRCTRQFPLWGQHLRLLSLPGPSPIHTIYSQLLLPPLHCHCLLSLAHLLAPLPITLQVANRPQPIIGRD